MNTFNVLQGSIVLSTFGCSMHRPCASLCVLSIVSRARMSPCQPKKLKFRRICVHMLCVRSTDVFTSAAGLSAPSNWEGRGGGRVGGPGERRRGFNEFGSDFWAHRSMCLRLFIAHRRSGNSCSHVGYSTTKHHRDSSDRRGRKLPGKNFLILLGMKG